MSFQSRIFLFSAITLAISSATYANTLPNAGSISRDIKQENKPTATQAVDLGQKSAREAQESDNISLDVQKIRLVGIETISETALSHWVREYESKTVTLGQLRDLTDKITAYYHQQGYVLAKAVLPPQRIEKGEVVIQVFEGKVANLQHQNQSRLRESVVQGYLNSIEIGKPLNNKQAERTLLLIKDLAGVGEVNYSLAEGKQVGETVLIAHLGESPAVRGNLSLDNHGSESTGEKRVRANVYIQSPFGRGETISVQGMTSARGLDYGKIGLELPLGYNGLSFNTSIARTRYELGGAFANLNADGSSDTFDFNLRYPLLRSNSHNVWLSSGGELRRLKDSIHSTNTETVKGVTSGNLSVNASFQDSLLGGGYTSINMQNTLGKLNIRSVEAREIDRVSAKMQGRYYKLNVNLSRTQYLNDKWSLWANLSVQWANKNLDSGEQLSLGGLEGVSAYSSNAASGDKGIIANLQLRYAINSYLSLNGFYDIGRVTLRSKPYLDGKNHRSLQGAGVGLNVQVKNLTLEAKSAWKIHSQNIEKGKSPRVWLKLTYHF
ncbi:ShlB/FhaC/HecB family hemolysin secretion/activation protein [Ursidibacter sp. B-7004-1]